MSSWSNWKGISLYQSSRNENAFDPYSLSEPPV